MTESTQQRAVLPEPVGPVASISRVPEGGAERRGFIGIDRNERVDPLPAWFVEELRARLSSELLTTYPAADEFHRELAESTGLPSEQLLVTPGNDPVIKALCQAYVERGDRIAMLDPSYAMYSVYARMFGAEAAPVPYDAELQLEPDELLASLDGAKLALIANPNQPTGTVLDEDLLRALLKRAGETATVVLVDEAYWLFSDGEGALPLVREYPNALVARSFSKAGFAGARVGFVAGDPSVVGALFKVRSAAEVSALAIECGRLLLAHPEVVQEFRATIAAGRAILEARARELGLTPLPSHANFTQIRLEGRGDPRAVADALKDHGWLVKAGFAQPGLTDCIRVTLAGPELMARFARQLRDVLEA